MTALGWWCCDQLANLAGGVAATHAQVYSSLVNSEELLGNLRRFRRRRLWRWRSSKLQVWMVVLIDGGTVDVRSFQLFVCCKQKASKTPQHY